MATTGARRTTSSSRKRSRDGDKAAASRPLSDTAGDEAEWTATRAARKIEGLDEEIAVLRVKLRSAVKKRPANLPLMFRGIGLLVKAVSARYRLSKQSEADLSDSLDRVIQGAGSVLMPEIFASE